MIESDKWRMTSDKKAGSVTTWDHIIHGKRVKVSGREKRQGTGAIHDASREIEDYREKSN